MKKEIIVIIILTLLIVVALPVSSNMKYIIVENVNNKNVSDFQSPAVQWTSEIGGTALDAFVSVQQTSDGGFIMTGESFSYSGGNSHNDIWLVKTDSNGNVQINTRFGVALLCWDYGMDVQQTSDGGYILTGYSESFGNKAFLMKTDSNLIYQWDITYGGSLGDWGNSLDQTTGGGFIIAGGTYSFGAGDSDVWLIKTDASGNKVWDKTFGGVNFDQATSVQQTSDGGYILCGIKNAIWQGTTLTEGDIWLIKTDANGNKVWDKTFGGPGVDWSHCVEGTSDGGYIIVGRTYSIGPGQLDVWLIKTDSSGNKVWDKTFGGKDDDVGYSVQQTTNGGYIITGYTKSFGAGEEDLWLIRTDPSGNKRWDLTLGGTRFDSGFSVIQTSDAGFIVAGQTWSYGAGESDGWLIKVRKNNAPSQPMTPTGQTSGHVGTPYTYSTSANDIDNDQLYYWFDWGDGTNTGWIGPYTSGLTVSANHTWSLKGNYQIKVKVKDDTFNEESTWSNPLSVTMPRNKQYIINSPSFQWFLQYHISFFLMIRLLLQRLEL